MHVPLSTLVAAIDWSYVIHQSPVRIVAIAATIYAFMQGVKQFIPLLSGWWAVAINILLSTSALLAITPSDQVFTPATMAALVTTVLTAAGIHGTVSKLQAGSPSPAAGSGPSGVSGQTVASKGLAILLAVGALFGAMTLTGCNNFERQTYNSLSASKAVLDQAQMDYQNGSIVQNQASFDAINRGKALQVLAVNAMYSYETIKHTGGTQTALDAQQAIVQKLIAQLPTIVTAVQALYPPKPPAKMSMLWLAQPQRA